MTEYVWRVAMVVPLASLAAARNLARVLEAPSTPEEEAAADAMFGIRLSASGQEPATHVGCFGSFTDAQWGLLEGGSASVAGLEVLRWSAESGSASAWLAFVMGLGLVRVEPD